ncbi:uncharacterized protein LOC114525530 [Dendronephthya gigantea]|uniref:uncharacterized protein LOC114525530 n=1 Tax=Dendronephthya gigantea TaxID=151771 RepID=UPI00106CFF12|nr:uncharacterized protein LOC114525530 [Dendronephthya gigantea]
MVTMVDLLRGRNFLVVVVVIQIAIILFFSSYFIPFPFTAKLPSPSIPRNAENNGGQKLSNINNANLAQNVKELSKDLIELQRSLVKSVGHQQKVGLLIQKTFEMLTILNEENSDGNLLENPQEENVKKEVCPEQFMGKKLNYGYPLFRKGFDRVDCKEFIPNEKLITIVAIIPNEIGRPAQSYLEMMQGIEKYYPGMRVILATQKQVQPSVTSDISKLKINFENFVMKADTGQGALLQELVGKVSTPYVLIAINITHFDDDINLERMVRILSYKPQVKFVGGAFRNLKGQWDMGCQQVTFRNITAKYMGGYYRSFNECVVCEFLSGPIMARTDTYKELPFDTSIKFGSIYDLFWRFKKQTPQKMAVSCPDVMFNIQSRDIADEELVTFANKHAIHRIIDPDGRVRWYGCRNGYSYTSAKLCKKGKGIHLSPADMENLADVMKFFMKACDDAGAICEFASGTMIGAVKFNGVLPWDMDGDIIFVSNNFTALKNLEGKIKNAGYKLSVGYGTTVKNGRTERGYFGLRTTNWRVELWGLPEKTFGTQIDVARGVIPTKVMFAGQWVNHPHNPGLFTRNRYGPGIYKHQEHWLTYGRGSSWLFYTPGTFHRCPQPGQSYCLDQYPIDGNMQFKDYCPL